MFVGTTFECGCGVSAMRDDSDEDFVISVSVCITHARYHQDKLKALADAVYAHQRVLDGRPV